MCYNLLISHFIYLIELKGEDVSVIGCGKSHTLIGTANGKLYSFGNNSDKQCGVDDEENVLTPTEVDLQEEIVFKQLCGGSNHSVALDSKCDKFPESELNKSIIIQVKIPVMLVACLLHH